MQCLVGDFVDEGAAVYTFGGARVDGAVTSTRLTFLQLTAVNCIVAPWHECTCVLECLHTQGPVPGIVRKPRFPTHMPFLCSIYFRIVLLLTFAPPRLTAPRLPIIRFRAGRYEGARRGSAIALRSISRGAAFPGTGEPIGNGAFVVVCASEAPAVIMVGQVFCIAPEVVGVEQAGTVVLGP